MPLSEPIKYALAICRLRMGCRNDSFLALSRILASASSLGAQAELLAGGFVFVIENLPPAEQNVTPIHNVVMNREPVRLPMCLAMYLPTYLAIPSALLLIGISSVRPKPYKGAVLRQKAHSEPRKALALR
jgi:hypothetical protein